MLICFFLRRDFHRKLAMLINLTDEQIDQQLIADQIAARIWHGVVIVGLLIAFTLNTTSYLGVYIIVGAMLLTFIHLIWKEYEDEVLFEVIQPWRDVKYLLLINSLRKKMTGYSGILNEIKAGKTPEECLSSPFMRDLQREYQFHVRRVKEEHSSFLPRLERDAKL